MSSSETSSVDPAAAAAASIPSWLQPGALIGFDSNPEATAAAAAAAAAACKHAATPACSAATCECWCDSCQAQFETAWDADTASANLCTFCGMPRTVTLAALKEHEGRHFYRPCNDCLPGYVAFMRQHNLCAACRCPLLSADGVCRECTCEETEACTCRECRMERVKEVTATASGR
jgi:hypothetical protein